MEKKADYVLSVKENQKILREDIERYFITSLGDIKQVAKSIRSHWGVESMHWTLDVVFNEDNSTKRAANAAYNYDVVPKMAMNMLKNDEYNHGKKKLSIRRKMLKAILDEKYLSHLLSRV